MIYEKSPSEELARITEEILREHPERRLKFNVKSEDETTSKDNEDDDEQDS